MLASLSFMLLYAHTLNPVPGDSIGAPLSRVVVSKSTNELLLEPTSWRFPIKRSLFIFAQVRLCEVVVPPKAHGILYPTFLERAKWKDSSVFGNFRCAWMSTEYLSGLGFLFLLCHKLSVTHFVWFLLPHPLGYISQLASFASSMSTAGIRTVFCGIYFIPLESSVSRTSDKFPDAKTHPFSSIMLGGKIKSSVPFPIMALPLYASDLILLLSSWSKHSSSSLSVSNIWCVGTLFR